MAAIVRTEGLTKTFGRLTAVDGVGLTVEEGDVYGFLGVNGAGKTTTLRMILGLIRPTAGSVTLFGRDARREFITIMAQVGSLVELPAYYPHLSARKNLEILRLATGGLPESVIPETLERVGLGSRMDDPVRTYSQGMRQRLGIAMALMPRPRLVFLDEPTNGLDPQGVHQIRTLVLELNKSQGVTFVISSHLLHEVEVTCNRVGIIRQGRLVVEDSVGKLLEQTGGRVVLGVDRGSEAAALLKTLPFVQGVEPSQDGRLAVRADPTHHAEMNGALVRAGFQVREFAPVRMSLEEYFLSR